MSFSGGDPWGYSPPLSLWKLVEQNVLPEEQEEIRSMLGTSLVETTLELHNEVEMLLEIWQDYQEETDTGNQSTPVLAEPPLVRDRLVQEICFLAEGVREKSLRKGLEPTALFSRQNSQILNYAEETKRSGSSLGWSRPMSARSSDGRQTPLSPSDQACCRADLSSTINEDVASSSMKLNYLEFNEVCSRLRETLTKEMEQLTADVAFLQGCLDNSADRKSQGGSPTLSREPTIAELREERSSLEKDLLSKDPITTPNVSKPAFAPTSATASMKMQSLGPITSKLRPTPPPSSISRRGSGQSVPLKASHTLTPSAHCGSASPDSTTTSPADSTVASPADSTVASPSASARASPDRLGSPVSENRKMISHNYDLSANSPTEGLTAVGRGTGLSSQDRGHLRGGTESDLIRRREGSGMSRSIRRTSPARVKVVPVGSILDPQADSASGRSFIPTPPPGAEKPQIPRPGSAERFRKMVMHYRETT